MHSDDVDYRLLAFADQYRVEEGRDRCGVVRARTARDDERVLGPLARPKRNARKVERLEYVRVRQFVRQCDADQIALAERRRRLERAEPHAFERIASAMSIHGTYARSAATPSKAFSTS